MEGSSDQYILNVEISNKVIIESLICYISKMANWENNKKSEGCILITMDRNNTIVFSSKQENSQTYTEIKINANIDITDPDIDELFFLTKIIYLDAEISGLSSEECTLAFRQILDSNSLRICMIRRREAIQTIKSSDELYLYDLSDGKHELHKNEEVDIKWKFHMNNNKMQKRFKNEFDLFSTKYSEDLIFKFEKVSNIKIKLYFVTEKENMESEIEIDIVTDEGEFDNCIRISYHYKNIAKFCRLFRNFEKEKLEFAMDVDHRLIIKSIVDGIEVTGKFQT